MKENPIHIGPDELLIKLLAGEATDAECQEVTKWMNASEENRAYFDSLQKTWTSIDEVSATELQEVDQAWEKFNQRTSTISRPLWGNLMRIAAVLLVGIAMAGTLIWWINQDVKPVLEQIVNLTSQPLVQPLPDGSVVHLKPKASVEYPVSFAQNERRISLQGEAFFEVEKNPEKPFVVQTPQTEVRVLGTSFLVKADPDDAETEVIVSTGIVSFGSIDKDDIPLKLEAGMGGIYEHDSKKLEQIVQPSLNESAWATGELSFGSASLGDVVKMLEDIFSVEIELENEALNQCQVGGRYEGKTPEDVLNFIGKTFDFEIKQEGNHFMISGTPCSEE